jgi:hypothetical protein
MRQPVEPASRRRRLAQPHLRTPEIRPIPNAIVLNALMQVPQHASAGAVDRAIAFLHRNTNSEGAVGKMDPLLYDNPNYATALSVQAR